MRYVCVFYGEEKQIEALSSAELEQTAAHAGAWVEELKRSGHFVFSQGLQSVSTATTLRRRDGRVSMTDGPFAETKEQLGGFTIIEARDLNEALQIASSSPCIHLGCVEVRPVFDLTAVLDHARSQEAEAVGLAAPGR
ncbi:YciI family protein [Singulisphaera sp. PoT]|uniref:YciI family protein n=1 Tax=Singulisphaera sp. PoT TaxID=3411797 RepID=UPI003BF5F3AA